MRGCQECDRPGIPCLLPDYESASGMSETVYAYLCPEHAFKRGHCKSCGAFWGGVESFEFRQGGLCDDCFVQEEAEWRADQERDDDDDDGERIFLLVDAS